MRCIAHRGFAGPNPENTIPAVVAAAEAGADCVEVDVRRCATGEPVVCHDETVDRVADGTGRVASLSQADLAALDVLGTGTGVPTLAAVLDAIPRHVGCNVELKERHIAEEVIAVLAGTDHEALVSSFDAGALAAVPANGPPTALLVGFPPVAEDADPDRTSLDRARELGCAAVHPHHSWCEPAFVAAAHDRDLAVNAWTVRDSATARRLAEAGVDGLIADEPRFCE